jgi:hypothetical protein
VAIGWPVPEADRVISERDRSAPLLAGMAADLPFEYAA